MGFPWQSPLPPMGHGLDAARLLHSAWHGPFVAPGRERPGGASEQPPSVCAALLPAPGGGDALDCAAAFLAARLPRLLGGGTPLPAASEPLRRLRAAGDGARAGLALAAASGDALSAVVAAPAGAAGSSAAACQPGRMADRLLGSQPVQRRRP